MVDDAQASMVQDVVLIGYGSGINLIIRRTIVLLHISFVKQRVEHDNA